MATVRVVRLLAAEIDQSVSPGSTVCGAAANAAELTNSPAPVERQSHRAMARTDMRTLLTAEAAIASPPSLRPAPSLPGSLHAASSGRADATGSAVLGCAERLRGSHDHDIEFARAVDALDPVQLDVRRGGRPRHERQRAPFADRIVEAFDGFGYEFDDLVWLHHAQVVVRHKRQGAPALTGAAVKHDRAGLG